MTFVPTPEQEAIISYPLAALRVSAGAGTGKTTTMAQRLVRLIQRGDTTIESSLGITFTNKAASELSDRLRQALPDESRQGREVEVTTYHGFANRLLSEYGAWVGMERSSRLITPGYARQLLLDSLATADGSVLDLTNRGRRVHELIILDGQMGDHLVDAGRLASADAAAGEVEIKRSHLAQVLGHFQLRKQSLRVFDYGDLIRLAYDIVHRYPEIADNVRTRYRVVLLDEYQDTNPAQRELLRQVFGAGFPLTAVGDADQTIYEWRGASLDNFKNFSSHFQSQIEIATLTLTENRRSGPAIVALANQVRAAIHDREPGPDLVALPGSQAALVAAWFQTGNEEAEWIAAELQRRHQAGEAWRDMAVLFRKHAQVGAVREALDASGIPYEVISLGGLLGVPEVGELHAWLRVLGRPYDTPALAAVLLGSRFRLGLGDLAPLAEWVKRKNPDRQEEEIAIPGFALLDAVEHSQEIEGVSAAAQTRLGGFRQLFRRLVEASQTVTLIELCRRILDELGFWPEVDALPPGRRLTTRLNLYRFLDLVDEWSPLEGRPSLEAFLDFLDVVGEAESPDELEAARVSGQDAVALITVHRAKGLEWGTVFLPALCQNTFPAKNQGSDDPSRFDYRLPYRFRGGQVDPNLQDARQAVKDQALKTHHLDQEWRVAYVAVTRAERLLIASGAYWYGSHKSPKQPSQLYAIVLDQPDTVKMEGPTEPGPRPEYLAQSRPRPPDPLFPDGWLAELERAATDSTPALLPDSERVEYEGHLDELRTILENLPEPPQTQEAPSQTTSVSGLVTYAVCPLRYLWSEVDRLPRRPAPEQRRGTELHRRIELHNRGVVPFEDLEGIEYDVSPGEAFTRTGDPYARFLASRFAKQRPLLVETPFVLRLDQATVRGRVDAVYSAQPEEWEVVDFKSGRPGDPNARVQLEAYAVAASQGALTGSIPGRLRVTFAFLGSDEEQTESVDQAWLEEAQRHLEQLLDGIKAKRFEPSPSVSCRGCDFINSCPAGKGWIAANRDSA